MDMTELEEAAVRYSCGWGENDDEKAFIKGAEWQADRMYSEKEVQSLLHKFMQSQHPDWHFYSTTKWFEKNKNK